MFAHFVSLKWRHSTASKVRLAHACDTPVVHYLDDNSVHTFTGNQSAIGSKSAGCCSTITGLFENSTPMFRISGTNNEETV
jgi:hypothetical protein